MTETQGKINSNDRFVRWQTVLRDQFSFLNNLILTISIGAIGFLISLLGDTEFHPECAGKRFFAVGLIYIFLSVLFGIITGFSRLMDYRYTLKKIDAELKKSKDMKRYKKIMRRFGELSWCLFYSQIFFFGVGILILLLSFSIIYNEKLF